MIEIFEERVCYASPETVYQWIMDIENYKTWMPYCVDSGIVETLSDHAHEAFLTMRLGFYKERLVTRNHMTVNKKITMTLVEGPFRRFYGEWELISSEPNTTRVSLKIQAELKLGFAEPIVKAALRVQRGAVLEALSRRFFVE